MWIDNYFTINRKSGIENADIYDVELNPDSEIYRGHFPGEPVSPGVCSIGMIVACASRSIGSPLEIRKISRCRFLSVISPQNRQDLRIRIELTDAILADEKQGKMYQIEASIKYKELVCLSLKGELAERPGKA
ncbi:hypothetical protein [Proteiniphilum sp. UBA5384]|uniref:ApeI family dehydratase n=1 Tax=Proteiniphilum sp. UBA5384 TaxID=1947279 RepID=UPI002600BB37|nr:hypothetical protein [Proteiniphilum sp. UBA5384]